MAKKTIHKTVISIVVLSEEEIPENKAIGDIMEECDSGNYIAGTINRKETLLTGKVAVNEIYKAGSEPEFFSMDDDGNSTVTKEYEMEEFYDTEI